MKDHRDKCIFGLIGSRVLLSCSVDSNRHLSCSVARTYFSILIFLRFRLKYTVSKDADRNFNEKMIDVVKYLIKYHKILWIVSTTDCPKNKIVVLWAFKLDSRLHDQAIAFDKRTKTEKIKTGIQTHIANLSLNGHQCKHLQA